MHKKSIRLLCKKNRIDKTLAMHFNESKKIQQHLFSHIDFSKYKNVFIYLSSPEKGEVDTWNIISKLTTNNIFVPKIVQKELKIATYDGKFRINKVGIFECDNIIDTNIDLAIVPMLAFNKKLHRIGYGGGYYDKFLKYNSCLKIGLCSEKIKDWVQEKHDISMDIIITPDKVYTK